MIGVPDWGTRGPTTSGGLRPTECERGRGYEAVPKPTPRTATSHGKGHACVWPSSTTSMANANDTQDAHRLRRLRDDRLDPRTRSLRRRHSAERDGNREPRTVTDGYTRSVANRQSEPFSDRYA